MFMQDVPREAWLHGPHGPSQSGTKRPRKVVLKALGNCNGRVLAFEVKAGERVASSDFRALRKLRESLGARFVAGVVLSLGSRSYTYEQSLHVMPVDRLWHPTTP